MNTKALNSLAALVCRAQEQDRTPMGIAFAIDAAGRHMSPEVAAELERLRELVRQMVDGLNGHDCPPPNESPMQAVTRFAVRLMEAERQVAELEAERHSTNEALDDAAKALRACRGRIAELEAQRERRRVRLVALQNDALSMRGSLSPMGEGRKVPFPLGEMLTPAVDWLIGRVAELEALTPARVQTCRVCGAGYTYGEPCSTCLFRSQMAAELQARGLAGEHEASVHRAYRVSHDLPESGGA